METFLKMVVVALMGATILGVGGVGGYILGATQPTPPPEVQVMTVEVPQYLDRYVSVPYTVTVEVPVEKIVLVTPTPEPAALIPPPTLEPTPVETEVAAPCTHLAWIDTQPKSDLQGDALKMGTINRLTFVLVNIGTCPWDGNVLVTAGEDPFPEIAVPYTPPGGMAVFNADDFIVRQPLKLRLFIKTPAGEIFGFENGNPLDRSIYYRLDTWAPISQAQSYVGANARYGCGPNG